VEAEKMRAHLGQRVSLPILAFPLLRRKKVLDLFEQLPISTSLKIFEENVKFN